MGAFGFFACCLALCFTCSAGVLFQCERGSVGCSDGVFDVAGPSIEDKSFTFGGESVDKVGPVPESPRWRASGSQNCQPLKVHPHNVHSYTEGFTTYRSREGEVMWLEGLGEPGGPGTGGSQVLQTTEEGEVMRTHLLNNTYFGEGVTYLDGKVYQLTWQADTVFIYDVPQGGNAREAFKEPRFVKGVISQFAKREGWGLTNDGERLIASDGSNKLYVIATTAGLPVVDTRTVTGFDPKGNVINMINELEYANGLVFFNMWQQPWIGVYDLHRQVMVSWLDCRALVTLEKQKNPHADVLNGIALVDVETRPSLRSDEGTKAIMPTRRLVLTGKLWSHLYEVDFELPPNGVA